MLRIPALPVSRYHVITDAYAPVSTLYTGFVVAIYGPVVIKWTILEIRATVLRGNVLMMISIGKILRLDV